MEGEGVPLMIVPNLYPSLRLLPLLLPAGYNQPMSMLVGTMLIEGLEPAEAFWLLKVCLGAFKGVWGGARVAVVHRFPGPPLINRFFHFRSHRLGLPGTRHLLQGILFRGDAARYARWVGHSVGSVCPLSASAWRCLPVFSRHHSPSPTHLHERAAVIDDTRIFQQLVNDRLPDLGEVSIVIRLFATPRPPLPLPLRPATLNVHIDPSHPFFSAQHMRRVGVEWQVVVPMWFPSLFTTVLPWGTVRRVWDMFCLEVRDPVVPILGLLRRSTTLCG